MSYARTALNVWYSKKQDYASRLSLAEVLLSLESGTSKDTYTWDLILSRCTIGRRTNVFAC